MPSQPVWLYQGDFLGRKMAKFKTLTRFVHLNFPKSLCLLPLHNSFFIYVFSARWPVSAIPTGFHKLFVAGLAEKHNYMALKVDFWC